MDERVLTEGDRAQLAQRAVREREHRPGDAGGGERDHREDREHSERDQQPRTTTTAAPPPGYAQSGDVRPEIAHGAALHCPVSTCLEDRLVKPRTDPYNACASGGGGIGRLRALKTRCPSGRVGSNPT